MGCEVILNTPWPAFSLLERLPFPVFFVALSVSVFGRSPWNSVLSMSPW